MEIVEYKRVVKHGGSYRLSIPLLMRKALNIRHRDMMKLRMSGGKIIVEKIEPDFDERKMK